MTNREKWTQFIEGTLIPQFAQKIGLGNYQVILNMMNNLKAEKPNWTSQQLEKKVNELLKGTIQCPVVITSDQSCFKKGYRFKKDMRDYPFEFNYQKVEMVGFSSTTSNPIFKMNQPLTKGNN